MKTTGNAGGVHNLIVHAQGEDLPTLRQTMRRGLMVTELMGQGVNGVHRRLFSRCFGLLDRNGKIAYPVHEIRSPGI